MFVPAVEHINVINKSIVYSDDILPSKDLSLNFKATTISDVGEYSLDTCLKKVFESNPDVIFNTIQYSKKQKTVIFYTNKEISTKEYEEHRSIDHRVLFHNGEVRRELENILASSEINKDSDCVSLYDVTKLIRNKYKGYDNFMRVFENAFKSAIKSKFGERASIYIYNWDHKKNEVEVRFNKNCCSKNSYWQKIVFAKQGQEICVKASTGYDADRVLSILNSKLSKVFDKNIDYADFLNQQSCCLNSTNSKFLIDIDCTEVSIYGNLMDKLSMEFELFVSVYQDGYTCHCRSDGIKSILPDHEEHVFKKVFVRIDELPEWSRPILYEMRQNQLNEEKRKLREMQRNQEEMHRNEEEKQKRKTLVNKIFPFIKN